MTTCHKLFANNSNLACDAGYELRGKDDCTTHLQVEQTDSIRRVLLHKLYAYFEVTPALSCPDNTTLRGEDDWHNRLRVAIALRRFSRSVVVRHASIK